MTVLTPTPTAVASAPAASLTAGKLPRWAPWALLGGSLAVSAAVFGVALGLTAAASSSGGTAGRLQMRASCTRTSPS